jgi:hypothetical protein
LYFALVFQFLFSLFSLTSNMPPKRIIPDADKSKSAPKRRAIIGDYPIAPRRLTHTRSARNLSDAVAVDALSIPKEESEPGTAAAARDPPESTAPAKDVTRLPIPEQRTSDAAHTPPSSESAAAVAKDEERLPVYTRTSTGSWIPFPPAARKAEARAAIAAATSSSSSLSTAPAVVSSSSAAPAAAGGSVLSSSSAVAAPGSRVTYYFLTETMHSYAREQLIEWLAEAARLHAEEGSEAARKKSRLFAVAPVLAKTYAFGESDLTGTAQFELAIKHKRLMLDVSRTNGDTTCSILHGKYRQPCILSANGRTYSKEGIEQAIQTYLAAGNPLRLEHGEIYPETAELRWYPNLSMDGWYTLEFSYTQIKSHVRFNAATAQRYDIPQFSDWLDQLKEGCNPEWHESLLEMYAKYKERRPDAADKISDGEPPIFKDLEVVRIPFPRAHPKHPACFKNVLFSKCLIFYSCFCGPRFYGCKFDRCAIYVDVDTKPGWWLSCEFSSCVFYWPPGSAGLGVPRQMIEHGGKSESSGFFRVAKNTITSEHMKTESIGALMARIEAGKTV